MKLTVDILDDFIRKLVLSTVILDSNIISSTETQITVNKTYHARRGMYVKIDGISRKIVSVVVNQSIIVEGNFLNPIILEIPTPYYFHGTPIMTDSHIKTANSSQKVPMIYLYEIFREIEMNEKSSIAREADLRLFFLDSANYKDWNTDDHYSNRLLGLNNLVDSFIEAVRKCNCFYTFESKFTRINRPNFGLFIDNKGNKSRILSDDLTGVELSFTLPIRDCATY